MICGSYIASNRERFYRCATEKLMTYALGRGLEPYDAVTVDRITDALLADGGQFSTLLAKVVESPAFQHAPRRRRHRAGCRGAGDRSGNPAAGKASARSSAAAVQSAIQPGVRPPPSRSGGDGCSDSRRQKAERRRNPNKSRNERAHDGTRNRTPHVSPRLGRLRRAADARVAGAARARRRAGRSTSGDDRQRHAAAAGIHCVRQRFELRALAPQGRGPRLRVERNIRTRGRIAGPVPDHHQPGARRRQQLGRRTRRPRPRGASFLTGCHAWKTLGARLHLGISVDQIAARQVGHLTRLDSLQLGVEGARMYGSCDTGYPCAYQYNISWASETVPLAPEPNPRVVFEKLFGGGTDAERTASLERRLAARKSVLDFVRDDLSSMTPKLGQNDRRKVDEYLEGVRSIERQIEKVEQFPTPEAPIGMPPGIPPDHKLHVDLMYDLMALAFQTDSTRVVSYCVAPEGSNRPFLELGITEGHHFLTHHGTTTRRFSRSARSRSGTWSGSPAFCADSTR